MNAIEILSENLSLDNEKLSFFTRRFPHYADELAKLLLGEGGAEATDEELELSYHEVFSLLFDEKDDSAESFSDTILHTERALLAAETIKALTERAKIHSFLPTLLSQEGKCVYFRNAYSDEAFRIFSPHLASPTASYTDSPVAACREVYNELATFAILPISSSKGGVISGIAREVARYELALTLTCEITLPGKEETMTMGLFAQTPIAVDNADEMEAVLFSDDYRTLTALMLSAEHLACPITQLEALKETEGFAHAYRVAFTRAASDSLFPIWLLLRCEYPHHRLCGVWRGLTE